VHPLTWESDVRISWRKTGSPSSDTRRDAYVVRSGIDQRVPGETGTGRPTQWDLRCADRDGNQRPFGWVESAADDAQLISRRFRSSSAIKSAHTMRNIS
jgi:hypothetical protein